MTTMGITSAKTPTSEATTYEKWFKKLGSGWGAAPSVQIIVDNSPDRHEVQTIFLQTGSEYR